MPETTDTLLTALEAAKSHFGPTAAAATKRLLAELSALDFKTANSLLRFHEALLFLRAFPQSAALVPKIEKLLNTFHHRVEKLRDRGADMRAFDDFDTSGISGTTMQDTLSFEVARWLARHFPRNLEIAWNDYWDDEQAERAMAATWPRFIPLLEEDSDVEANIPWRRWLDTARGRERDLEWLIRQFEQLPISDKERSELYDSLHVPVRWNLENLKLSRTRNWTRPRRFYFHTEPLIGRSQVSLADELSQPAPRLTKLSPREGERILGTVREVMLVRYRELYGTSLSDPHSVVRADVGRGVTLYLWNLPPARRLPLRAYVAGFTLKNGVPINYVEAIGLCEWIEVGFNTFYTYRHGETAWIYAQFLRCLHAFTGATTFAIYPYQIGQQNDEALDSGAFWFYRKLGFRSGRPDLEQLARGEEQKIAANPQHRTSKKILKRLAEAHMFYEGPDDPTHGPFITVEERPFGAAFAPQTNAGFSPRVPPGPWDTFSTRNLALRVNRRMARDFNGDSIRICVASVKEVTRALRLKPTHWTPVQRRALENWSLILALIPNLTTWSSQEKLDLIKLIQSKSAPDEMNYLRQTQHHPRVRAALLRLGSKNLD